MLYGNEKYSSFLIRVNIEEDEKKFCYAILNGLKDEIEIGKVLMENFTENSGKVLAMNIRYFFSNNAMLHTTYFLKYENFYR